MFGRFRPVHYLNHAWATKIAHGERLRGPVSRGIAKCHNPAHPGLDLVSGRVAPWELALPGMRRTAHRSENVRRRSLTPHMPVLSVHNTLRHARAARQFVSDALVDAPRSSVGKVSCPSGQRTQVRTPVAEWSGKSNCGRMVREVKLPGELDTTDTHTDAQSAKKDVISTKPQKAMGAERTFPREDKRKSTHPLLAQCPPLCVAVIGARYPVQSGQAGARRSPSGLYWCGSVNLSLHPSLGGGAKRISIFFNTL